MVLPGVDESIKRYRELGRLRARLADRAALPQRARALEERVKELQDAMAPLDAICVPPESLSLFKQDLTRMARSANCRLRSIQPGPASRNALDFFLGISTKRNETPSLQRSQQWQVETQVSSVSVQGSYAEFVGFLASLDSDRRALRVTAMNLRPFAESNDELILDLQIETLNLVRG
jgi:hypothetical protein